MTGPVRHSTHSVRLGIATRGLIAVLLLATGLVACSTDSGAGERESACIAAFRSVDPRALPPYGASPLDDAIRRCGSLADWRAAWDAVPAAHEGDTDPLTFLADRCALESLSATSICRELASAS